MKTRLSILLAVIIALSVVFISCGELSADNLCRKYDVSIENLSKYDYDDFCFYTNPRNVQTNAASKLYTLKSFNEVFPVERIEKIDSEHIAVVYKMTDEAGKEFKVYTLFAREIRASEKGEEFELWHTMNEYYYCNDILSLRDYADVCEGDTAEELFAIDETVIYDNPKNEIYFTDSAEKNLFFKTYRPLKEGIMVIRCDASVENGQKPSDLSKYTITEIDFYEYGAETEDLVFVPAKNIFTVE